MKSKIVDTIVAVLIGVGGFYGGIYYGTIELDMMMDELSTDYILIKEDVDAFVKVSDPETIQFYVKKLNDILDDIHWLGHVVESGQVADEALGLYEDKINGVNEKIILLKVELYEELESLRLSLTVKTDDKVYGLKEDVVTGRKAVLSKLNGINIRLDALEEMVSELSTDVDTIKNSKYGKKIWSKK
tara:strand:+ start:62 stop:622 length:561 start_codon:yes stop_codon:yes gene_type:complete